MKVQINKDVLVSALDKMYSVSTKALVPNFNFTGKVTIEVKASGRAVLTSSNGCLTVQEEIELSDGQTSTKGICTTDSVRLRNSVIKILTETPSDPIELSQENDTLFIRDAVSKRRKLVKLPVETNHHNTHIMKKPDGDSLFMEAEHFVHGFRSVSPFMSRSTFPPKYQTILFHWTGKETRMVCGDGAVFAIMTCPRHSQDSHKREVKRTLIVSQLAVIANLFESTSEKIEMVWKDKTTLWLCSGKTEILARGLPDIDYINYESNGYRFQEAKAFADIEQVRLKEVTDLLVSLQDKEIAEQGKPYSCIMQVPSSPGNMRFDIRKSQGKFQCEYEIPAEYHDLGDQPSFECCYAHLFFQTPSQVMRNPYLRLYLIDEVGAGVVNARDADLGDADRDGIPVVKEDSDGCSLQFFFARLTDDENEDEDAADGEENEEGEE